jgi:hypothetical protein
MRGYPSFNFPSFEAATIMLRARGWEVISPAEHDLELGFNPTLSFEEQDFDLAETLRWDLEQVILADMVIVLPGWRKSHGACTEVALARTLNKPILQYPEMGNIDEGSVCLEAADLVSGPRQGSYGHPADDFTRTGRMWGAILGLDEPVPPHLVGLCQVALKISREVENHKRDNLVDIAGYAETLRLVQEKLPRE